MPSTLDRAVHQLATSLAVVSNILERPTGPGDVLALLGWDMPPAVTDIGVAALDLSALVDAIETLESSIAAGVTGLPLDEQYATVALALEAFLETIDATVHAFNATPDYLQKTGIVDQFAVRLLDFVVVESLSSNAMMSVGVALFSGIVELQPFAAVPDIYQVSHIRRVVHWDRIPRIFSDVKGLLSEVYGWGAAGLEPELLTLLMASILQGFGAGNAIRALPRRAEALLVGHDVPEADTNPMTQFMLSMDKGLGWDPIDVGISFIAMRPTTDGGTDGGFAIAPYAYGSTELTIPLSDILTFTIDSTLDATAGIALIVRAGSGAKLRNNLTSAAAADVVSGNLLVGLALAPATGTTVPCVTIADGIGLEAASLGLSGGVDLAGGKLGAMVKVALTGGHFKLDSSQMDSFLASIIPLNVDLAFDFGFGWSAANGLFFEGSASPTVAIAMHDSFGPFTIDTLHVGLDTGSSDTLPLELSVTGSATLGPFAVSADRLGITVAVGFHRGNLGPVDLNLNFKPPSGIGLALDAGLISGGGYLYIDEQNHRYAGVLECSIAGTVQVKVIGVIDTVLPDGAPGFSMLLVITTDFPPIQLGFGFTLDGVGGIGGIGGVNRTMSIDALRGGFKSHQLDALLAPPNPIANAPKIISDLSSFFPPASDRFIFGPLFALGWGTPRLLTMNLAFILEVPDPTRLVILGEIALALPSAQAALIKMNVDVLGIVDFGAKLLTIQGEMYDSRVLEFAITGDMAMMLAWGDDSNFAFSIGGLNPKFAPPVNFPQLKRCCVSIGSGDNPRISAMAYFAITSNSAQFGASADLRASAGGFGIHGTVGFDALFVFSPFSFAVDFAAGLDVQYDGESLCSVHVDGTLSGPRPWHVHAEASFHILFFDVGTSLDLSWGDSAPVSLPPVAVLPDLTSAFANPQSWTAVLPSGAVMGVSLAPRAPGDETLIVHPIGTLEVREKVVPLDTTISKYGNAVPTDGTSFTISAVTVDGQAATKQPVTDQFAIGQFTSLTDDQQLSAPSFQEFDSGISIGTSDVVTSRNVACILAYQDGYIDGDDTGMRVGPPYAMPLDLQLTYSRLGAGFVNATRTKGFTQFTPPGTTSCVTTNDISYVIAGTDDLISRTDILPAPVTQFAAQAALRAHLAQSPGDRAMLQVVSTYEAAA
jgi:hypothetical protein